VAVLERARTARTGVYAVVISYLSFVTDQSAKARFIHASAYAAYLPAHADMIEEAKRPRVAHTVSWLAPHIASSSIVDLPDPLTEMLLIGPVAEISRRWLSGAQVDLTRAAKLVPARTWAALRGSD
jgi:cell division inhibitor SulA